VPSTAPIESKVWLPFKAAAIDKNGTSLHTRAGYDISDVLNRSIEMRIVGQKRGIWCHKHVINL